MVSMMEGMTAYKDLLNQIISEVWKLNKSESQACELKPNYILYTFRGKIFMVENYLFRILN